MKIAVASQNRRDITEHAGRCRKFWIYHIAEQQIMDQDFRFPSYPRRRESSNPLKKLDTRLRGYDEFTGLAKILYIFTHVGASVLRWQLCSPFQFHPQLI